MAAAQYRCERALVWSWAGDGGFIVIHDTKESVALSTALRLATDLLKLDVSHLRDEFKNMGVEGTLSLRVALHKGTIRYTSDGQQGFIHSSDINFVAHLEKATPANALAISQEVFDVGLALTRQFQPVGELEGRQVFLYTPTGSSEQVQKAWLSSHGLSLGSFGIHAYTERPSQAEKARLIDSAETGVIDFGTTLNTCSTYLATTERPAFYRNAVFSLLRRGGTFDCYLIAPESHGAAQLGQMRGESVSTIAARSRARLLDFKTSNAPLTDRFSIFEYEDNLECAALIIDITSLDSLCLYSPYLASIPNQEGIRERADMPQYLTGFQHQPYKDAILAYVTAFTASARRIA